MSRIRQALPSLAVMALLIAAWTAAVVAARSVIFPTPWQVVMGTVELVRDGTLWNHIGASLFRVGTGFALAVVLAIPLGLWMGWVRDAFSTLNPLFQILRPISPIAWIPIAILWFGLSDQAVVFVVFTTALFPLLFNTEAGARQINPVILNAGRCFGASGPSLFFRVVLPATVPFIITGLRISLGTAWRMIVAGEMLASQDGIGYLLMQSRFQFRAVDLMTAMILISIVGYLTERLIVDTIEKRTTEKWEVQSG
jgi:NitT/TauT family transport system permease protein